MSTLDEIVADAGLRHERGEALIREVVEREGAAAVVVAVTRLLRARAPRAGEALLFLMAGEDIPALLSAIEDDDAFAALLDELLSGRNVRERRTAIWALGALPVRDKHVILEDGADALLREAELVSLSALLAIVELPDVIDRLVESDDWIVRWSLLPWTNRATESPLADDVRRRLAFDDDPVVAAEAHQHLMILDEWNAANAGAQELRFGLLSNHGPARAFASMASAFVDAWPPPKTAYVLDELRTFALAYANEE